MPVDVNCDMGESFGRYELGDDAALLSLVTSANIACGLHAGDPLVMARTVRAAAAAGVGVGAHPGYPDLQGFGRRAMDLSADEVAAFVTYQIGALAAFAQLLKVPLTHVKPHGALYNRAAVDAAVARAIAQAVKDFSRELILVGLAGSALIAEGSRLGLRVANEGFPDRVYEPDGALRSRRESGAVVESPEAAAANAVRLATTGLVQAGRPVTIDTLCIHGDNPGAAAIAGAVRSALAKAAIPVMAMGAFLKQPSEVQPNR
jgi:UPF0271 protein